MFELIKKLMLTPSVSGREDKIREVITKEVSPYSAQEWRGQKGYALRPYGRNRLLCYLYHKRRIY